MVPKKPAASAAWNDSPAAHHQAPAQHNAGVDQEVEHDAEEIEPAGRPALFRNGFDAELLDAGRLTIARTQAALDVGCGSHRQFCAPHNTTLVARLCITAMSAADVRVGSDSVIPYFADITRTSPDVREVPKRNFGSQTPIYPP
jgi:hypothetical protein